MDGGLGYLAKPLLATVLFMGGICPLAHPALSSEEPSLEHQQVQARPFSSQGWQSESYIMDSTVSEFSAQR